MPEFPLPVLGFAAFSGTGKTTLLKQLLPVLKQQGIRVAVVKHAHHNFETDKPGKDSYELRKSGAAPMLITSSQRMAMMMDFDEVKDPSLTEMIDYLPLHKLDCVLVEGFKHVPFNKIELHRPVMEKEVLALSDPNIIAIATDDIEKVSSVKPELPHLDLNNITELADFVCTEIERQKQLLATGKQAAGSNASGAEL
ncbi:MAG: molybdopterin-guanine dinucleotide biosynthesis protein B [Oceanospirillum sp.]|nr:molybdopterin-guanine dinucleotide biosynthesis protein B [Oceanospirillum sp.]